jgi:hypothetical protein
MSHDSVNNITVITMPPPAQDIPYFDGHPEQDWRTFIADYELAMKATSVTTDQMARQLPRYLRSRALTVYRKKIAKSGIENDYRKVVETLAEAFQRDQPQRGMKLLNIRQKKNQRVGDYQADFERALQAAYPDGMDEQTEEFVTQIFIKGLLPKHFKTITRKDRVSTIEDAVEIIMKREYSDLTTAQNTVSAILDSDDEDEINSGVVGQVAALMLDKKRADEEALGKIKEELNMLKQLCIDQTQRNQTNYSTRGGHGGRGRGRGRGGKPPQAGPPAFRCYNCGGRGHMACECKKPKRAPKPTTDQPAAEPNEPPPVVGATAVQANRGPQQKLPLWASLTITLCIVGCFGKVEGVMLGTPLVCGGGGKDKPIYWALPDPIECSYPTGNTTGLPQDVQVSIYAINEIKWRSQAWQCSKFEISTTTQKSFFGDVKTMSELITTRHTVTADECWTMVNSKVCTDGDLVGSRGVYQTLNHLDIDYNECCKPRTFTVKQCSAVETAVYERYGQEGMEAVVGDVSHCQYSSHSCQLQDHTLLVWEESREASCQYLFTEKVSGKLVDDHFITNELDLALTFTKHGDDTIELCDGNQGRMSDQGLVAAFNGTESAIPTGEGIPEASGAEIAVIHGMLQVLAEVASNNTRNSFWQAYRYTCKNMKATLQLMNSLLQHHPTTAARHLLGTTDIMARSFGNMLAVYACTAIDPAEFTIMKMGGDCTAHIPVQVNLTGRSSTMYLDPQDNVLHTRTWSIECGPVEDALVYLNGSYYIYDRVTGDLELETSHRTLVYPHIQSEAHRLPLPIQIFSKNHLATCTSIGAKTPLDDLLATLSRQQQVLRTMGLKVLPEADLEDAARESSENIFQKGWFSFLFGSHVGSPLEIWTFACNIAVSASILILAIRCCCTRSGLFERIALYRQSPVNVAAVEEEEDPEQASLTRQEEGTETANAACAAEAPMETSTPPYRSLYPDLPKVSFTEEIQPYVSRVTIRPGKAHASSSLVHFTSASQQ